MMISDAFIEQLPEDAFEAARLLCGEFYETDSNIQAGHEINDDHYFGYIKAHGIFQGFVEAYNLPIKVPPLSRDRRENVVAARQLVRSIADLAEGEFVKTTAQAARLKFATKMGKAFHYEFSDGDFERAQILLNEIRNLITKSQVFDESHRRRLLARLERVQSELHKKVSDLDKFWGLVGDAGVALGKFGNDAKPLLDRIKELTLLVWATQARAEGLPSNVPPPLTLPSPETPTIPHDGEPSSIVI